MAWHHGSESSETEAWHGTMAARVARPRHGMVLWQQETNDWTGEFVHMSIHVSIIHMPIELGYILWMRAVGSRGSVVCREGSVGHEARGSRVRLELGPGRSPICFFPKVDR